MESYISTFLMDKHILQVHLRMLNLQYDGKSPASVRFRKAFAVDIEIEFPNNFDARLFYKAKCASLKRFGWNLITEEIL